MLASLARYGKLLFLKLSVLQKYSFTIFLLLLVIDDVLHGVSKGALLKMFFFINFRHMFSLLDPRGSISASVHATS